MNKLFFRLWLNRMEIAGLLFVCVALSIVVDCFICRDTHDFQFALGFAVLGRFTMTARKTHGPREIQYKDFKLKL
jgi:hypothetical protein